MRSLWLITASFYVCSARLIHSLPDDTYAFPKFRVAFLNALPVLNQTAERWLTEGLRGGESEFLDQPWSYDDNNEDLTSGSGHTKSIDSGDKSIPEVSLPNSSQNFTLEHMKMGPRDSYICLIPKPPEHVPAPQEEDSNADMTPARSWSLLQPLSGTCLYHRQGWFTYSYCHNDEIRQFKELIPKQTRLTGTYKPEEDPEHDAYTLGRAPQHSEPGADLTVAEQNAQAANLELARNAGSRYLVQRWGDGTICDKTGKSREVEIQETKTCSYVLVVHTPRLCGEPGFKSRRDIVEDSQIRCREVVETLPQAPLNLPTTDHPMKMPLRKPVLPASKATTKGEKDLPAADKKEKIFNDLLLKAYEALIEAKSNKDSVHVGDDDSGVVIELLDEATGEMEVESDRLVDALRAAGYDVRAEVITIKSPEETAKSTDNKESKKTSGRRRPPRDFNRDEL
ncbi:hypothetical protein CVT24_009956 [Panaeolus cyanescens]|uniref:Protein OS-9 homolog n=1 Tax=Panaeolus cyanescens TaxID=181874 RepID=A0A409VXH9_9AGAR|nr:hypothetical protein CVT24_009956 [Panaeolus cyanescens]